MNLVICKTWLGIKVYLKFFFYLELYFDSPKPNKTNGNENV